MIKENNNLGQQSNRTNSLREALGLPKYATVGSANLIIDLIRDEQMTEMYGMIFDAMQHGEGYGVDEFQSEEELLLDINGGPSFAVMNAESGKMVAGFSLAHSKYYRSSRIQAVDPIIIVKKNKRGQGLGEFIFHTSLQFAKKLGYAGIYADTFTNNTAMRKIIEKRPNFLKVGTLPLGGKMPDGTLVGVHLYFLDLTTDNTIVSLE